METAEADIRTEPACDIQNSAVGAAAEENRLFACPNGHINLMPEIFIYKPAMVLPLQTEGVHRPEKGHRAGDV